MLHFTLWNGIWDTFFSIWDKFETLFFSSQVFLRTQPAAKSTISNNHGAHFWDFVPAISDRVPFCVYPHKKIECLCVSTREVSPLILTQKLFSHKGTRQTLYSHKGTRFSHRLSEVPLCEYKLSESLWESRVPLCEYNVCSTCEEIECLCVSTMSVECLCVSTMRACEKIECLCVSTKALDFLTGGADLSQRTLYLSLRERLSLYLTIS